jgi:hypothetical protein
MQVAFEEVCTQIANMNSFVQERVWNEDCATLNREKLNTKSSKQSTTNTKLLGLKRFL